MLDKIGQMQNGNVIVSLPPDFFQQMNSLLEYYQKNEERKRKESRTGKEYITPDELAAIVKRSARTIRDWCKDFLAPACSKQGNRITIEKNQALALIEAQGKPQTEEEKDAELSQFIENSRKRKKRYTEA